LVTYDTLIDTTQEKISSVLSANSSITAITSKILPGTPYTDIQKSIGMPYIKVETPTYTANKKTFSTFIVSLTCPVVCYNTQAAKGRELADAVRKALTDNRFTMDLVELDESRLPSSTHNESLLDDGRTVLYTDTITATYQYWGEIDV
jgi:hypothetical protein